MFRQEGAGPPRLPDVTGAERTGRVGGMDDTVITIVGAGTMGANIALDFASHGFAVRLSDISDSQLEVARATVKTNAGLLADHGLFDEVTARIDEIVFSSDLARAVDGATVVIEAVSENLAIKRTVFAELERLTGTETILASNTSTFMPSVLAEGLSHPERLLVLHYWNPAHLVPLVEVVPHTGTSSVVVEACRNLLSRCGKQPVVLAQEVEGFIGNRLAFAVQREAMDLVARGIATPEEIDTVVKTGFGRRMPVSGVFGTADLGGLDVYQAVCASLYPNLCDAKAVPAGLVEKVKAGKLGVKTGEGWSQYDEVSGEALREAVAQELIRQAKRDRERD